MGSAEVETYDQLLECVLVGPVNVGNYRFVLQVKFHDKFLYSLIIHYLVYGVNLVISPRLTLQTRPKSLKKISLV